VNPQISSGDFNTFFAWAPLVVGIVIYAAFFIAKRHEGVTAAVPGSETFACSQCGRRGPREQMVAQSYGGATGWQCAQCAQKALA
jgi:hypothetical protein